MIDFAKIDPAAVFISHCGEPMVCVRIENEFVERLSRDFAVVDGKGRRMGAQVVIRTETRTVSPSSSILIQGDSWLGEGFNVQPHATRDGRAFGALLGGKTCQTREEVDVYVERYFREAEKRARKSGGVA